MRKTVEVEEFSEEEEDYVTQEKTLILPDDLKADVGDEADRRLDAEIRFKNKPNNSRGDSNPRQAEVSISQARFSDTVDYIVREMVDRYNRGDDVDVDNLTNNSKKEVGRYYFNQLEVFESKKKE